jgi:hypothetical protein
MKVKTFSEVIKEELEYNATGETKPMLDKILRKLGVEITENSDIISKTKFGKLLCNMASRDGLFDKIGDNLYRLHKEFDK